MTAEEARPAAGPAAVDDTYPRLLQAGFALLVALEVTIRVVSDAALPVASWPALGLFLVAGATAATAFAPRRPGAGLVVVPVLDIAGLGLLLLSTEAVGLSALVVLPALWLGRRHGRCGALVAVVASVLLVSLPSLLQLGPTTAALTRAVVVPAVAGLVATTVALMLEALRARTQEAVERGAMLETALAELRREARRSETLLDTVDVGMVLLDADGSYRAVNRRHRDFLDLAFPQGHRGRAGQSGDVYAADRRTPLSREEMPAWRASTGEEFDGARLWVGADPATQRALSVSARAVRDAGGTLEGAVLAYHDVTDLLCALEARDEFLADVSHELRTPLTSIIGYLDVLQDRGDLDDDVRAHLEVLGRNATRLLRLVTDLLHPAASGGAGRGLGLGLRMLPEELGAVVREAVEAAGPAAQESGVRLEVQCPEPVTARVDRDRLAQALAHLLSNAVRYNRRGGAVQVRVAVEGEVGVIEVADTGVGMEAQERDQLFVRFFRGVHAREQAVQGIGLGLTIARAIVEGHGGRIGVESEPGVGTTVRVELPLSSADDAGRERRAEASPCH